MKIIPRWRAMSGKPHPTGPFVADVRTYDIPNTIAALVRVVDQNCVAVTLRPYGGAMVAAAERAARKRGMRILWVPIGTALKEDDREGLRWHAISTMLHARRAFILACRGLIRAR